MEESPNELRVGDSWKRGGKNKKPLYVVILMVCVLGGSLLYMFGNADNRLRKNKGEAGVSVDSRQVAQSSGQGLILPPPPPTPPEQETSKNENKVTVITGGGRDDAEAMRKRREQQLLVALSSPLIITTSSGGGVPPTAGSPPAPEHGGRAGSPVVPTEGLPSSTTYDPAAARDKEGFFERADTKDGDAGWLSRYTREDGRLLEIKTGTVIPAVMVGGINSDLPGVMIAQVSQNVYNTANGKYLLIPQGSKLYGVYDSRVVYGQERVLVAWNRIIFPDGSSVTLGAMPGADMGGYAGFKDKVNNHYVRIFGTAVLMSAVIGTTAYAVDQFNDNGDGEEVSFQDELGTALANQMGTAAMQILQRNLGIAPTLEIRPGYQFNVVATKDVVFSEPYIPHDYEAAYE